MTVVGHFKSCSLYYPGRNECKVGQNNLPLYFFYWLVFVYHEHEPSGIFLTGVQLHILLVNLLLATIRCLNFAKEENVGYPINFKNPTWIKCHDCYKFRRHSFLLGVACSCSDRLDCDGCILLVCVSSCLAFLLEGCRFVFFPILDSQV